MLAIFQKRIESNPMTHSNHLEQQINNMHNTEILFTILFSMFIGLVIAMVVVAFSLKFQTDQSWKSALMLALNMSFVSMILTMVAEYGVRYIAAPFDNIMNVIHSLNYFSDPTQALISILALSNGYIIALLYNYYLL
jgi:uncharacterized protein YacL